MSSNKTSNYQLHLWEPQDDFLREEFNENSAMIDAAMADNATRCRCKTGGYTGTASGTNVLNFGVTAKAVIITCNSIGSESVLLVRGQSKGAVAGYGGDAYCFTATWSATGVTLVNPSTGVYSMNVKGNTYFWCVFY